MDLAEEGSEKEVDEGPPKSHKDDQKELQELKKRKGCWKLAPRMITEKNVLLKDIIMSVAKSSWWLKLLKYPKVGTFYTSKAALESQLNRSRWLAVRACPVGRRDWTSLVN